MRFKNLQLYRLSAAWNPKPEALEAVLAEHAFQSSASLETQQHGWISPLENDQLAQRVNGHLFLSYCIEKKLLPTTIVNQVAKERALEFEAQQGYRPGKKKMREIKESVTDELLPRAFSLKRSTRVWIDPKSGWLAIDCASSTRADEVVKLLMRTFEDLPLQALRTATPVADAMTAWLMSDEPPSGFTVDQDTELRALGENRATVRYVRHTLEAAEVRRHIEAGKQCTRLALTWSDKISFVLTEALELKRVAPLDILTENADARTTDAQERQDADLILMTTELVPLLNDLVAALGGAVQN